MFGQGLLGTFQVVVVLHARLHIQQLTEGRPSVSRFGQFVNIIRDVRVQAQPALVRKNGNHIGQQRRQAFQSGSTFTLIYL